MIECEYDYTHGTDYVRTNNEQVIYFDCRYLTRTFRGGYGRSEPIENQNEDGENL